MDFVSVAQSLDPAIRADLESLRNSYFHWLLFSTAIVALGLTIEAPEIWYDTKAFFRRRTLESEYFTAPVIFRREHSVPAWVKPLAAAGWLLIVAGVIGEGATEALVSDADGILQSFNKTLLAEATKKAGDAKTSADEAASAAQRAKDQSGKAVYSASNALNLARDARLEADSVHQQIGKASGQLTQLKAEAEKTKSDLINLALCNAPRVINNWSIGGPPAKSYVDSLRPMAGQIVFIEVVPDAEARRAALNIARTLVDAQWNVQKPWRFVDGIGDGVSVQPSVATFTGSAKGEIPNMAPYWHASDVAEKY